MAFEMWRSFVVLESAPTDFHCLARLFLCAASGGAGALVPRRGAAPPAAHVGGRHGAVCRAAAVRTCLFTLALHAFGGGVSCFPGVCVPIPFVLYRRCCIDCCRLHPLAVARLSCCMCSIAPRLTRVEPSIGSWLLARCRDPPLARELQLALQPLTPADAGLCFNRAQFVQLICLRPIHPWRSSCCACQLALALSLSFDRSRCYIRGVPSLLTHEWQALALTFVVSPSLRPKGCGDGL